MKIHHIGYLVKNIEKAVKQFENLGFLSEGDIVFDEYRGIDILFMTNGDYRIELVSPITDNSVVAKTIKTLGNSPYHICYYCENIDNTTAELRQMKYVPVGDAAPASAFGGRRVVFLFNRDIGIIELLESKEG